MVIISNLKEKEKYLFKIEIFTYLNYYENSGNSGNSGNSKNSGNSGNPETFKKCIFRKIYIFIFYLTTR